MKPFSARTETRRDAAQAARQEVPAEAGLLAGTTVLASTGETPIEELRPSDRVITRDSGLATLEAVGVSHRITRLIRFSAGSLGLKRRDRDLFVPGGQLVLVRDWRAQAMFGTDKALVPAQSLVDHEFICDMGLHSVELFRLRFDEPRIIYAGGLEVTSAALVPAALRRAA